MGVFERCWQDWRSAALVDGSVERAALRPSKSTLSIGVRVKLFTQYQRYTELHSL
jgi:hypothetical protein